MLIIGLTGGIGSGKSCASRAFAEAGYVVIDADQVAREVIEPGTPGHRQLRDTLSSDAFDDDGRLERTRLRELAFCSPEILKTLESVIHPLVTETLQQKIEEYRHKGIEGLVLEVPLLLEAGLDTLVDYVVVVDLPKDLQRQRAMLRDGASEAAIERIMMQQLDRVERLRRADFVLDNTHDPSALAEQVYHLLSHLRTLG